MIKAFQMRLTHQLYEAIQAIAKRRSKTNANVIRQALESYCLLYEMSHQIPGTGIRIAKILKPDGTTADLVI